MKNKKRNTELDFLYKDEKTKKQNKKTKSKIKQNTNLNDEQNMFNFDNEIVIGVTKAPQKNKKKKEKQRNTKNRKKKENDKIQRNKQYKEDLDKKNNENKVEEILITTKVLPKKQNTKKRADRKSAPKKKKRNIVLIIFKYIFLTGVLIAAGIFFCMSPTFNITEIKVYGNEKIDTNTISSLSKIQIGENIFRTSKKDIQNYIKQEPYVENVNIRRKLPNIIEINIQERKPSYMIEYLNNYAYINNQGYILEISEQKLQTPIIIGISTQVEQIEQGKRLQQEDLEKLEVVLKIMGAANANNLAESITRIDISNKQNYTLILEEENKTVHMGDETGITDKIRQIKEIVQREKGVKGEIFIRNRIFFREG